jgi:superfamily II DNA helicase RecQ
MYSGRVEASNKRSSSNSTQTAPLKPAASRENFTSDEEFKLEMLRIKIASLMSIAPLTVFNDKTKLELLKTKPKSLAELDVIEGFFGTQRAVHFGKDIVAIFNTSH